jgi:hypothetical protein
MHARLSPDSLQLERGLTSSSTAKNAMLMEVLLRVLLLLLLFLLLNL